MPNETATRRAAHQKVLKYVQWKLENFEKMLDKHAVHPDGRTWRDFPATTAQWEVYRAKCGKTTHPTLDEVRKWAMLTCRWFVDEGLKHEAKMERRRKEYRRKHGYSPPW